MRALILSLWASFVLAPPAQADDLFDINSVLVAAFEADQPFLATEAERVRLLVEEALGASYVVVTMPEVPAFTDYTADVYLRSCPKGQYIGCVFVVGGRAKTDWTVGGRVSAVEGGFRVDLSFIDVGEAKLVLEFDVVLDGSNDAEFQEGVVKVVDALVRGEIKDLDVRRDPEAERAAKREEEERVQAARRFAADSVYEELSDLDRGELGEDAWARGGVRRGGSTSSSGRRDRVASDDLDDLDTRGGLSPWERVGLTKAQYKLYRNSKLKLRDFKDRMLGRKGELLIRAGMTIGGGPYGQQHESFYVLAPDAGQNPRPGDVRDQASVQSQFNALGIGGGLEVGIGITSWFEVALFGQVRNAPYNSRVFRERVGVDASPRPLDERNVNSLQGGLRVGLFPMPAYPARPFLQVGASFWSGSQLQRNVEVPQYLVAAQFVPNNFIFAHVNPGVEINAGKRIFVWLRGDFDLPLAGREIQTFRRGDQSLTRTPPRESSTGLGVGGSFGVTVRLRLNANR